MVEKNSPKKLKAKSGSKTSRKSTNKASKSEASKSDASKSEASKKSNLTKGLAIGAGTAAGVVLLGLLNKYKEPIKQAIKITDKISTDNRNTEAILANSNAVLRQGNIKVDIPQVSSSSFSPSNTGSSGDYPVAPAVYNVSPVIYTGSPSSYTVTPTKPITPQASRVLDIPYTLSPMSFLQSPYTTQGTPLVPSKAPSVQMIPHVPSGVPPVQMVPQVPSGVPSEVPSSPSQYFTPTTLQPGTNNSFCSIQ